MDGKDDVEIVKVHSFDGQTIWLDRQTVLYEVGNFLGGGAAGTVYECEHAKSREHYALKILNPLGYKLSSPTVLRRCTVLVKGKVAPEAVDKNKEGLSMEHIWWLLSDSTKQYLAAYYSQRNNALQEISLVQCCQIWGTNPESVGDDENGDCDLKTEIITPHGQKVIVPVVPPKFADFIRKRKRIFTEIKNMRKISNHVNVIRLEQVLELTQESKCTIFLVMELANGGELFDRIKIDCGTREGTAKIFFHQLLLGVRHCHNQGVCHRDLKPENLLLQDTIDQNAILKIADFGFSARFVMGNSIADKGTLITPAAEPVGNMDDWKNSSQNSSQHSTGPVSPVPFASSSSGHVSGGGSTPRLAQLRGRDPNANLSLRVLKSVVGSPFYVAPEVLQAKGYDGQKADVWSLGVILYAMLAGNLPFEQELSTCKRYKLFSKWVKDSSVKNSRFWSEPNVEYPDWLFTSKFSALAKSLIVAMLSPDPEKRISVAEAMSHPLLHGVTSTESSPQVSTHAPSASTSHSPQQQQSGSVGINGGSQVRTDEEMRISPPRVTTGSPMPMSISSPLRMSPGTAATNRSNAHSPPCSSSIDETSMLVSGLALAVSETVIISDRMPPVVQPGLVYSDPITGNSIQSRSIDINPDDNMKIDSTDDMDLVDDGPKDGVVDDDEDDQFLFESGDEKEKINTNNLLHSTARVALGEINSSSSKSQTGPFSLNYTLNSARSEDMTPSPFYMQSAARSLPGPNSPSTHQQQQIQSLSTSLQAQQQYLYSISPSQEPVGSYIHSIQQAHHNIPSYPGQQHSNSHHQQHPVFMSQSLSSSVGASVSGAFSISTSVASSTAPVPVPLSTSVPGMVVSNMGQRASSGRMSSFMCPPPPAPTGSLIHGPDIDDLIVDDESDGAHLRISSDAMDDGQMSMRDLPRPQPLNISATSSGIGGGYNAPFNVNRQQSEHSTQQQQQQQRLTSPLPPVSAEGVISPYKANQGNGEKPPSFHDLVKRSTRFITAVPAFEVLEKVESVLEQYLFDKVETPIGHICKIEVHRKIYRLEVWGPDTLGPPLCALQLYQLPPSVDASPARYMSSTPSASESYGSRKFPFSASDLEQLNYPLAQAQQPTLFLVEFIRGQLEIFAFKRFYQWVRQRLSELVKRDYAFKLFEQAASPMVDSTFIQRYHQHNS